MSGPEEALAALDLADRRHRRQSERRSARVEAIAARLAQLRQVGDANDLLDRVCADAVETCGFARAMISQVDDGRWFPWMVYSPSDVALDEEFARDLRGLALPFKPGAAEEAAWRERRPVTSHEGGPASHLPTLLVGLTSSYVVVPLIASGRVIGLIHGDHAREGSVPDAVDRDALWVFGEGFALIYERAVLAGRMRAQRDRLRDAFEVAEALSTAITTAEMTLMPSAAMGAAVPGAQPSGWSPPEVADGLTVREKEVAELMARGLANAVIAERLVIAPNTIKTHVRNVIRKLGALNRSDAVARYLRHTPDR